MSAVAYLSLVLTHTLIVLFNKVHTFATPISQWQLLGLHQVCVLAIKPFASEPLLWTPFWLKITKPNQKINYCLVWMMFGGGGGLFIGQTLFVFLTRLLAVQTLSFVSSTSLTIKGSGFQHWLHAQLKSRLSTFCCSHRIGKYLGKRAAITVNWYFLRFLAPYPKFFNNIIYIYELLIFLLVFFFFVFLGSYLGMF